MLRGPVAWLQAHHHHTGIMRCRTAESRQCDRCRCRTSPSSLLPAFHHDDYRLSDDSPTTATTRAVIAAASCKHLCVKKRPSSHYQRRRRDASVGAFEQLHARQHARVISWLMMTVTIEAIPSFFGSANLLLRLLQDFFVVTGSWTRSRRRRTYAGRAATENGTRCTQRGRWRQKR